MLAPGLLAFAGRRRRRVRRLLPARRRAGAGLRQGFPRLYGLVYDKWRIDELYDATVVGMVDALADIFTMADKWIIDGILAGSPPPWSASPGTVLRALQTGRVQAYSASMVIGLAGLGWFLVRPHADGARSTTRPSRRAAQVTLTRRRASATTTAWASRAITTRRRPARSP